MVKNEIKTTMNTVMITGNLVKNGLDSKTDDNGNEYIGGSLILRSEDGSEHQADYFSYKYKRDSDKKFTNEESGLYKGYVTIMEEYKGMDALQEDEAPMVIKIGQGQFTDNLFMGKDGNIVESNKIRATFANRVEEDKLETTPKTATFQISGYIKDIKDELLKNGTMTGNKLIYVDTIGYGGTITPIKLTILKDKVQDFISAGFYPMGTGKFAGKIVNTVEEYDEPQAFGEPIKRQKPVKRLEVTGGSPLGTLEQLGITQEQYEAGKSKRRLKMEQTKAKGNNQQPQDGFTQSDSPVQNTNPQQSFSNPFNNPFSQQ